MNDTVTRLMALAYKAIDAQDKRLGHLAQDYLQALQDELTKLFDPVVEPVAYVNNDGVIIEIADVLIVPGMKLYTSPQPPAEPADWHHFPKSNTGVAADAIDAVLSERNYPASPAAAARCGWEAAHRLLRSMLAESADEVPLLTDAEIGNLYRSYEMRSIIGFDHVKAFARAVEQVVRKKY